MEKLKKIVFLSLCLFILTIMFSINTYAAEATISAPNVKKGDTVTVTVKFPAGTYGYEGSIQVILSDGTVLSGDILSKFGKTEIGTATFSTKVDVEGNATARAIGLKIYDVAYKQVQQNLLLQHLM